MVIQVNKMPYRANFYFIKETVREIFRWSPRYANAFFLSKYSTNAWRVKRELQKKIKVQKEEMISYRSFHVHI